MYRGNLRRYAAVPVLLAGLLLSAVSALASEESPVGKDTFKLAAGVFLPAIDSQLRINSKTLGTGTIIDLEDDLGFDEDVTLGVLGGYWRFAKKHRLYFGYYGFDRNTSAAIDKEIVIDDTTYVVGAELKSNWDIDFVFASYGYSFFQGEKWELSGSLGFYYLTTSFTVKGIGTISGEVEAEKEITKEESLELPIPLFGLSAEYYFSPKWRTIISASLFTIAIGDWDGSLFQCSANLEYLFHKNFGVGAGYTYFDVDVERDRETRISHLDYKYSAVQVYGIWHF
ncbi:MAG: hypothetical protein AMJ60_07610 [Desulfobacterales bacterium SG8_35]|nr:MAG: hypothetical protein AMJ60_07610 [Desulfobacterales bacterium SG8_35]